MKVLWVNTNFMHPTTKGGQIRTLEMLRHLHCWHEIHYVAIADPSQHEGPARASEYSFRSYPYRYKIPRQGSLEFWLKAITSIPSPVPLAVSRFHPQGIGPFLEALIQTERFDRAVVDHLAPTAYFPDLSRALLFQHNVETIIWRRRLEHASGALRRWYIGLQARRMYEYERGVSLRAGHVVTVSKKDSAAMRDLFGVNRLSEVPTGVNLEYFRRPGEPCTKFADLVFVGSMDWLPNVDGVLYFVREVLPLVRRRRPECSLAIVGRTPPREIQALSAADPRIQVTGTVADIRPYLWGSTVSIVPLRIAGGTRLKIFEAMAASIPVVSTTIGAEGLFVHPPDDIRIADDPQLFADHCLDLLDDPTARERTIAKAFELVNAEFSWEQAARSFEKILSSGPRLN